MAAGVEAALTMEPPTLRKAGSKQEEAFGVQPRRVADLGTVPSLRRSNSSLRKVRRSQNLFGNSEKVGFRWPAGPPSAGSPRALVGPGDHPGMGVFLAWAEARLSRGKGTWRKWSVARSAPSMHRTPLPVLGLVGRALGKPYNPVPGRLAGSRHP